MQIEEEKDLVKLSSNLQEIDLKMIGNHHMLCQIVRLLAYIRNVLNGQEPKTLTVRLGEHIKGRKLLFDVNGLEVPDLIAKDEVIIN